MKVFIIGVGMGNLRTLTRQAEEAIHQSDCLIGARRLLDAFSDASTAKRFSAVNAKKIAEYLSTCPCENVSVLMSGDVGFYSGAKTLLPLLRQQEGVAVECIAGVGSVQYFCARLGVAWEDAKLLSLHGRRQNLCGAVAQSSKTFVLTGGEHSPQAICKLLCESGLEAVRVSVGERLSYPEEAITTGTAAELAEKTFDALSVLLVENDRPVRRPVTHGLPEEAFLRGAAPMTKTEVRAVSICKLRLCPEDIFWDVGAGTGSVSIEVARVLPDGRVYAVEKEAAALELLRRNKQRFNLHNLQIAAGEAPAALEALPAPNAVFIGGSSGNLEGIFAAVFAKNPQARLVINAITLQTLATATQLFEQYKLPNQSIVQLTVARAKQVGKSQLLLGQNPVYILSAGGKQDEG